MLRLIIMRHGEAASHIGFDDKGRKLTSHGVEQARTTTNELANLDWVPDLALVSTAARTRETFAVVQETLVRDVPATFIDRFYLGSLRDVVAEITDVTADTLLLVGHNPGWSEMASLLTSQQIGLCPAQACLLTIQQNSWSEAMHLEGEWQLESWIKTF